MSQKKEVNQLQAGFAVTLTGGALFYGSTVLGGNAQPDGPGSLLGTLDGVLSHGLPLGMAGLGAMMAGLGACVVVRRLSPRGRVRARFNNPGWAGWLALRQHTSARAMLTVASHTRYTYGHIRWWNRSWHLRKLRNPLQRTDYGIYLGKTVVGPELARSVYASHKDTVLAIAPTQSGKTAWLSGALIDAPGAVVATSTKLDIWRHTYLLRQKRGPVYLFNPEGLGEEASTLRWNPVRGCDNYKTAQDRAAAMCRGVRAMRDDAHNSDMEFWENQATKLLRCLLMAAAVSGRGMESVARWVASPGSQEAFEILREHADKVPAGWDRELRQILTTSADKTRESIFLTLSQSVKFMADPDVAAIVAPCDEDSLDLERFVEEKGTLYLLGKNAHIAPLLVALTQHLFEGASRYAVTQPGDRLDPPVSFVLDEAALIVPVDLAAWVADAGGRGLNLIIAMQALAQLYKIYGERGGQIVQGNANCQLFFGGLSLPEDQRAIADNCGTWDKPMHTETAGVRGRSTSTHTQKVATIEPAMVRMIPPHHALVIYRGSPATLVRTRPVWDRRDVRDALRGAGLEVPTAESPDDETADVPAGRWERIAQRVRVPRPRRPKDVDVEPVAAAMWSESGDSADGER